MILSRNGDANFASAAIRAGLIVMARQKAKEGEKIFVPPPDWKPEDGHEGLVPLTVKQIQDGVVVCEDNDKEVWALWRS